eukprot:gene16250-22129_t
MSIDCIIRKAVEADLQSVRDLIHFSLYSLTEHYPDWKQYPSNEYHNFFPDITADGFQSTFLINNENSFWVAESPLNREVIGCVGLKQTSNEESELVRMAVSPKYQRKGIASKLIAEFDDHCKNHNILRCSLTTSNPDAAKFYNAVGFVQSHQSNFVFNYSDTSINFDVYHMNKYNGDKIIRHVTIVGGTHGNERLGIELVKQWKKSNLDELK